MRRWFMLIFVMTSVVFLSGCEDEDIYSTREEGIGTAFVLIGESFDPMEGVRIIQVITEDHGSTVENDIDDIEVIINNVNTSRIGEYEVSYKYEAMEGQGDKSSKTFTVNRRVFVLDHEPWIRGLRDHRITLGTELDLKEGISVLSYYDGDITNQLELEHALNVNQRGEYPITYRVSDSDGRETVQTITVHVYSQTPPTLTINEGVTNANGEIHVPLTLEGFTSSLDDPANFVSAVDVAGIDITDDIEIEGTVLINQLGPYVLTYTVSDMDGNTTSLELTVVVVPNQIPIIHQTDFTVWQYDFTEFGEKFWAFSATDPEDGDLTDRVTWELGDFNLRVPGVYTITFTAIDSNGGVGTRAVSVTVKEDLPPVITGLRDFSFALRQLPPSSDVLLEGITVTDDKDGDLTSALRVFNNVNRFIPGTYLARYFITDSGGNRVIETVTVTLRPDTDPFFEGLESRTIKTHSAFDPLEGVTAHDEEDGDLTDEIMVLGIVNTSVRGDYDLTYSVTDSDGNTTEVTITITVFSDTPPVIHNARDFTIFQEDVSGFFSEITRVTASDFEDGNLTNAIAVGGNFDINNPGTYTLTYSVNDSDDNEASVSVTVTVLEDLPPIIHGVTDVSITVGDTLDLLAGITVEDDRDAPDAINLSFVDDVDVNTPGVYTVTYTAIDSFGNVTVESATVTVLSAANTAPVIHDAVDIEIFQGDVDGFMTAFNLVTASDLEDGDVTSSLTIAGIEAIDLSVFGVTTITYTVTDSGGLTTTEDVTLTIIEDLPPSILGVTDVSITAGDTLDLLAGIAAEDDRDAPETIDLTFVDDVDVNTPGVYTVTYTAIDSFGNVAVETAVVTVLADITNEPPVISGAVDIVIFQGDWGGLDAAFNLVTVFDLEDGDITSSLVVSGLGGNDLTVVGTYPLTYMATDSGGLTTTVEVTLTILNAPNPTLSRVENLTLTEGAILIDDDLEARVFARDHLSTPIDFTFVTDLDTSIPIEVGTYTITYTAVDAFGGEVVDSAMIEVIAETSNAILDVLEDEGIYGMFLEAISASGLTSTLEGVGPLTVLAPDDFVFEFYLDFIKGVTFSEFLELSNLEEVIGNHIILGDYTYDDLLGLPSITALSGNVLELDFDDGLDDELFIEGVGIVEIDIFTSNGIILPVFDVIDLDID